MKQPLAVIAIGGNSLISDKNHMTIDDQYSAICETVEHIADLVEQGWRVVISHGNGPQVGFILRRSEIANDVADMHQVPLVNCGADTQGAIGYQIQQALDNAFTKRSISLSAVTLVTQIEVDEQDEAFAHPNKPIGQFYTAEEAEELKQSNPDWHLIEDAGRGYRRMVASPQPQKIVELDAIKTLIKNNFCVVAGGGGGIPVTRNSTGDLQGQDAVIDKDRASSLMARQLDADLFIISTGVPQVCLNFGKENQINLNKMSYVETQNYMNEGHFAPGSMLPKMEAALDFLKGGGKEVVITNPENLKEAVLGGQGTHITL